eukprot:14246755-Alexandrium_andersonii.AAC.1
MVSPTAIPAAAQIEAVRLSVWKEDLLAARPACWGSHKWHDEHAAAVEERKGGQDKGRRSKK